MTNRHWQHIKQLTQHAISVKDSDILWFFIFPNHDFEVLSFHCLATAPKLDNDWPWTHMETLTSIQACSKLTSVKVTFTLTWKSFPDIPLMDREIAPLGGCSKQFLWEVWKILAFCDFSFSQTMILRFWVSTVWPQLQTLIIIDLENIWKQSLRSNHVKNWLPWKWRLPWLQWHWLNQAHNTAQQRRTQQNTAQPSTAPPHSAQQNTTQHNTPQHSRAEQSTTQTSTAQHSTALLVSCGYLRLPVVSWVCSGGLQLPVVACG